MNYMNDKHFLEQLDLYPHKTIYAKIIALTLDEKPVEEITGKVTAGTINIDGSSAVRRTCNLTLLAYNTKVTDYYWGLTNKFKLQVGVENLIDKKYPDIIWFNQGIYAITSFSSSQSTNSYNISIGGKDKMCYLNGEIGGTFGSSIDINHMDDVTGYDSTGQPITDTIDLTVQEIIKQILHRYGNEPFHNIIINDLDECGLELMQYNGDTPIIQLDTTTPKGLSYSAINMADDSCWLDINPEEDKYTWEKSSLQNEKIKSKDIIRPILPNEETGPSSTNTQNFEVTKYTSGQAVGYRITDLVYPGDLIANVGETITSVLDKIKNMFGDFEYFYDVDGRFIFQKRKIFVNAAWTPITKDSTGNQMVEPLAYSSAVAYSFTGNKLITAVSNNPKLDSVKNDFCVWGNRKSVSGAELPIHMRYAIHDKPEVYTTIHVTQDEAEEAQAFYPGWNAKRQTPVRYHLANTRKLTLEEFNKMQQEINKEPLRDEVKDEQSNLLFPAITQETLTFTEVEVKDWRELIYIMAQDYIKYNQLDNFEDKVIATNAIDARYTSGRTGYEQYYEDMLGFWRLLYYPNTLIDLKEKQSVGVNEQIARANNFTDEKITFTKDNILDYVDIDIPDDESVVKEQENTPIPSNEFISTELKIPLLDGLTKTFKTNKSKIEFFKEGHQAAIKNHERLINEINKYREENQSDKQKDEIKARNDYIEEHKKSIKDIDDTLKYFKDRDNAKETYYIDSSMENDPRFGWAKNIFEAPETLLFWIDFLDTSADIEAFSIPAIGSRPKVNNDKDVKAIKYRDTPNIIFYFQGDQKKLEDAKSGYSYIQLQPAMKNMFSISSQGKTAFNVIDEWLYTYAFGTEGISLTTIPIYYLQPNTRILVENKDTLVKNEYIVDKITIPLAYNGTMSISATKAIDRLY